jgi:hypothetical protein
MPTLSEYLNQTGESSDQNEAISKVESRLRYLGLASFLFFAIKGVVWLLVGAGSLFLYAS